MLSERNRDTFFLIIKGHLSNATQCWVCIDVGITDGVHGNRSLLASQLSLLPAIYMEQNITNMIVD